MLLTTTVQQKIFGRLLSSAQNLRCADCNAKSPTWASIDFGVFVCLNCSGAHRALGPSITRVRSTKLDTWQNAWIEHMGQGNLTCNQFWEQNIGNSKKPTASSDLQQIKKFVIDKYVKRKFIKQNGSQSSPEPRGKSSQQKLNTNQAKAHVLPKNSTESNPSSHNPGLDIFDFDDTPASIPNPPELSKGHSLDFNLLSHGNHNHTYHSNEHHSQTPTFYNPVNFHNVPHSFNFSQPHPPKQSVNSTFSHPVHQNQNVQHMNNFANIFSFQPNKIPQNIQMNSTQPSAPSSISSFDIFGESKQTSSNPSKYVNINMFANNINFNFGEKAKVQEKKDKDPFNVLDEFNF